VSALHLVGDVGEHGWLEKQRSEVRTGVSAGDNLGALGFCIIDVVGDGLDLVLGDQTAHVGGEVVGARELHGTHLLGELAGELVGDLALDIDPLDRDAQLAGVGEAGAGGGLGDLGQVGALGDDHRVFAAQFRGEPDQPGATLLGQRTAGGAGSGEHQIVALLHDRGPHHRPRAGHHREQLTRQTGLIQQFSVGQRAVRGLAVRFDHHGVTGQQCGDGVRNRQCHRVIPL